jgi:CBS domain-containing protein
VITAGKDDTIDQLMSEMTIRQFRHMPVVERGRLVGLVSIGDLVAIHVADAEFESDAMRQYITAQPSLLLDQASRRMTDEELIEGPSFPAYHRVSTAIFVPAPSGSAIEMVTIDPLDLQAAQDQDAMPNEPAAAR